MTTRNDELHSEKVRGLLGGIPSSLIRWSTVVIIAILVIVLAVVCLLPYPYSQGESIIQHLLFR